AWSCLQVYKIDEQQTGTGDIAFLKRVFQKLLLNFTWWVNRKDKNDNNIFEGGFLGLDNIGVFDRSSKIPGGGVLEQVDGTSWMAMYCLNMLEMAIIIAQHDKTYEDVTTKFFEHFVYIADALNRISIDWPNSWDDKSGFFYDVLSFPGGKHIPLKIRSLVGLTSLFAVLILKRDMLKKLPEFYARLEWFRKYRKYNEEYLVIEELDEGEDWLLSLVPRKKLEKLLSALFDKKEFLAQEGIRYLSKIHETPYNIIIDGREFVLSYQPGESKPSLFGGNSNWRGPVWMPMNYLIVQSLHTYGYYYKDKCCVSYPAGSEEKYDLNKAAHNITKRLISIFKKDNRGNRPVNDGDERYRKDPHFKDLVLF